MTQVSAVILWAIVAGSGSRVALPTPDADRLEPITLVANQACGCSPAVSYRPIPSPTGWQQIEPTPVDVTTAPRLSPTGVSWLPSSGRNLAPRTVQVVEPVVAPDGTLRVFRPIVDVPPPAAGYRLGQGLIGQPKVYIPGQPIRNFVRYLSP